MRPSRVRPELLWYRQANYLRGNGRDLVHCSDEEVELFDIGEGDLAVQQTPGDLVLMSEDLGQGCPPGDLGRESKKLTHPVTIDATDGDQLRVVNLVVVADGEERKDVFENFADDFGGL